MFRLKNENPDAFAEVRGAGKYEDIKGNIYLYEVFGGTVIMAEVYGFSSEAEKESKGFFGFHIHEGAYCTGNEKDPFADTLSHYNPKGLPHPEHSGDLPPLLSDNGIAWMSVYTARFYPEEVVGKTVVIHTMPDDFRTQPSGGAGAKIACGEIVAWEREYH